MDRKIKIGIFFPKDSEALFNTESEKTFGGASVQMYGIAKELSAYPNIETLSIIPDYSIISFKDEKHFNLVKLYKPEFGILAKFLRFVYFYLKHKPDYIIQHGLMKESCIMAVFCKIFGSKMIFMFAHDIEVRGLSQTKQKKVAFFKYLLRNSYKLITQNMYQRQYLLEKYNAASEIIYNGFEPKPFRKKRYAKNLLWVARCDKWKAPELFIRLAELNPGYKFTMVCPVSSDESFFNTIKNSAEKIKNLNFVPFVPFNKIDSYFQKASVFVNTSDFEGFPQVFIQSMINASPILSLNVNPENFITKNRCGFCCNGNFDLLNQNLRKILTNEELFQKLSKNSYDYADKNHNITSNVKQILNLIQPQKPA
ncbi:MAG: glycosyltransferase family 4 protein [Leptospirales bacterium]|nr:glycosyltransferase family 4 protein [Leptospirales bacterium]